MSLFLLWVVESRRDPVKNRLVFQRSTLIAEDVLNTCFEYVAVRLHRDGINAARHQMSRRPRLPATFFFPDFYASLPFIGLFLAELHWKVCRL